MGKTIITSRETRFLLQKLNERNVESFYSEGNIKLLQLCCLGSKGSPGARINIRSSVYALLILKTIKTEQKDVYIGLHNTANTFEFWWVRDHCTLAGRGKKPERAAFLL